MATHEERFRALLAEWGIAPTGPEHYDYPAEQGIVVLAAGTGGMEGWTGFYLTVQFNEDGSFKEMGVWE